MIIVLRGKLNRATRSFSSSVRVPRSAPIARSSTALVAPSLQYKIHRIPIVDDSKRVVGMVTRTDLFNALAGRDAQL